jgi:hypothetical protein
LGYTLIAKEGCLAVYNSEDLKSILSKIDSIFSTKEKWKRSYRLTLSLLSLSFSLNIQHRRFGKGQIIYAQLHDFATNFFFFGLNWGNQISG